jgi:hypothetical protein
MHPVITEAIAAERARESQAYAQAARLARQSRRARRHSAGRPVSRAFAGLRRLPHPLLRAQVRDGAV